MIASSMSDKEGKEKPEYPYLGITKLGAVILLIAKGEGYCLHEGTSMVGIGTFSTGWNELPVFKGTLTLRNKE